MDCNYLKKRKKHDTSKDKMEVRLQIHILNQASQATDELLTAPRDTDDMSRV